jgi:hypothetical protein
MFLMHIAQRRQTGSNRPVNDLAASQFPGQYGTGSAVSLPATDLGARQVFPVTDKIQQQGSRRIIRLDQFVIEYESYHVLETIYTIYKISCRTG